MPWRHYISARMPSKLMLSQLVIARQKFISCLPLTQAAAIPKRSGHMTSLARRRFVSRQSFFLMLDGSMIFDANTQAYRLVSLSRAGCLFELYFDMHITLPAHASLSMPGFSGARAHVAGRCRTAAAYMSLLGAFTTPHRPRCQSQR